MTSILYAVCPSGPEITRRALLRRLRCRGVVVALPAGHYLLGDQRAAVDDAVAEINMQLRSLAPNGAFDTDSTLRVHLRPLPTPTENAAP